ncbi:MAG: Appr-1-p processing protein, partial [Pseudomonadales bacterium]
EIERALGDLSGVEIIVYEPTNEYQNVQKRMGTKKLTPARAIVAELVRRYWIQGLDCSLLEIQKMAWFAERVIETSNTTNVLDLQFRADRFGPYARRLNHLLNALDGSYLHCEKRIADAGPLDTIWFDESRRDYLKTYIAGKEFRPYLSALERTYEIIDGFESPFGLELLATIDWLLCRKHLEPEIDSIQSGLSKWPKGGDRKLRLFDERAIGIALGRLRESALQYRWSA